VAFALLVPNPESTACCLDMLADRAAYPEVLVRAFGSLPIFWLKSVIQAVLAWLRRLSRRPQRGSTEEQTPASSALPTEDP
jgi:hypothetical protein